MCTHTLFPVYSAWNPFFRWVSGFFFLLAGLSAAVSAAPAGPAVTEVMRQEIKAEPERYAPDMIGARLTMFDVEESAVAGELYVVNWVPPPGGTDVGTELQFEYAQERNQKVRTLRIRYPFSVRKSRAARFRIQGSTFQTGGPVRAWRVRLVQGRKVLAVRSSPSWGNRP